MHLHAVPFRQILEGKRVEIRLLDAKRRGLREGQLVLFLERGSSERRTARIEKLRAFPDYPSLVNSYSPEDLGCKGMSREEIVAEGLPYYDEKDICEIGLLAIEIKVLFSETCAFGRARKVPPR